MRLIERLNYLEQLNLNSVWGDRYKGQSSLGNVPAGNGDSS